VAALSQMVSTMIASAEPLAALDVGDGDGKEGRSRGQIDQIAHLLPRASFAIRSCSILEKVVRASSRCRKEREGPYQEVIRGAQCTVRAVRAVRGCRCSSGGFCRSRAAVLRDARARLSFGAETAPRSQALRRANALPV